MATRSPHQVDIALAAEGEPMVFAVTVTDRGARTQHRVTLTRATWERLTGGQVEPEDCVRAAFDFLLEREPAGDILPGFDLNVIRMYYPNFDRDLAAYLPAGRDPAKPGKH